MTKRHELFFDTSAFIKYYNNEPTGSKAVKYWIEYYNKERANKLSFFLPNICISETLQALYYSRYVEKKIETEELFLTIKATLLQHIEIGKYHIFQIVHADILKTIELQEIAKDIYLEDKDRDFLSAMDIKILAMAFRFKKKHQDLLLVTSDIPMSRAAEKLEIRVLDPNNYRTFPGDEFKPPLHPLSSN